MLQQPPAFWKLPGEFIAFTQVAGRTGQNEVTDIVGRNVSASNTGEWKRVIDMIGIFALDLLKSLEAVVTFAFLVLQLLLDLLRGILS